MKCYGINLVLLLFSVGLLSCILFLFMHGANDVRSVSLMVEWFHACREKGRIWLEWWLLNKLRLQA